MKQLIICYRHGDNDIATVIIPQEFRVFISVGDNPGLEISIMDEDENELARTFLTINQEDYPILQELSYEEWRTNFDENFTHYLVSDICNYLHNARYYDDDYMTYQAYFDLNHYAKRWSEYLKIIIDHYREECERDNNENCDIITDCNTNIQK